MCLLINSLLASCKTPQERTDARATEIAAEIFATQTAVQSLITPSPTSTSTPTKIPIPDLSGVWRGTLTYTQTGKCSIGGNTEFTDNVLMVWTVSEVGEISIEETLASDEEGLYIPKWSGSVDSHLNVNLQKEVEAFCGPETHTYFGDYKTTITKQNGSYALEMETIEAWCPEMECVFDLHYSISKSEE